MAPCGGYSDRALEGDVLGAAVEQQRAHRRGRVGAMQGDAADDLHAGAQRDRIGQRPASRAEGAEQFGLIADQAEIDRIARDPEAGPRDQIVALDELLAFGALPDRGKAR